MSKRGGGGWWGGGVREVRGECWRKASEELLSRILIRMWIGLKEGNAGKEWWRECWERMVKGIVEFATQTATKSQRLRAQLHWARRRGANGSRP